MEDIKNRFYLTLEDKDKKKFKELFKNSIDNSKRFDGIITDKKDGQYDIDLSEKTDSKLDTGTLDDTLKLFLEKQIKSIKECKEKILCLKDEELTLERLKQILKEVHKYKEVDLGRIDKFVKDKKVDDLKNLVLDEYNIYDLSYIYFHKRINFGELIRDYENIRFANAHFICKTNFTGNSFTGYVNFEGAVFYQWTNFNRCIFEKDCSFESATFKAEVEFLEAYFNKNARFARSRFEKFSSFENAKFEKEIDFDNTIAKDLFYFHNVSLGNLNLIGSHLDKANFLRLHNNNKKNKVLLKDNLANKDTARILKAHFENENNTTETNIYFVLEQEFYLDLLIKKDSKYPNRIINLISLCFSKHVSNFGTDWVRVLIVMFGFSFLASLGYNFFSNPMNVHADIIKEYAVYFKYKKCLFLGLITSILFYFFHLNKTEGSVLLFFIVFMYYIQALIMYKELQETVNSIITLINPLNIFSQDVVVLENGSFHKSINYFETIALYGVVVKLITTTLIYQFIISFRNSSRRK